MSDLQSLERDAQTVFSTTERRYSPDVLKEIQELVGSRVLEEVRKEKFPLVPVCDMTDGARSVTWRRMKRLAVVTAQVREPNEPQPKHLKDLTARQVKGITAEVLGFETTDLEGPSRGREVVEARQIAMWVTRNHVRSARDATKPLGFQPIGREFGGRDHTTVMGAVGKIDKEIGENPELARKVESVFLAVVDAWLEPTREIVENEVVYWVMLGSNGLHACQTFELKPHEMEGSDIKTGVIWPDPLHELSDPSDEARLWEKYLSDIDELLFAE